MICRTFDKLALNHITFNTYFFFLKCIKAIYFSLEITPMSLAPTAELFQNTFNFLTCIKIIIYAINQSTTV